jgi:hypothetical protein
LVDDCRVALVSATGSTRMGREVAPALLPASAARCWSLAAITEWWSPPRPSLISPNGDHLRGSGTAGQRCTTLRRLFVHGDIYDKLVPRLKQIWAEVPVGNPLQEGILVGPLIDGDAFDAMQAALRQARAEGGDVSGGERLFADTAPDAFYVRPALVEMPGQTAITLRETFAPILYVMRYSSFDEVIALHNAAPQGLSSSIFTTDLREAELFLSAAGLRLRDRQRQHRSVGRRDRRRFRWREGDWRRARKRLGRLAHLHAPRHQHDQLQPASFRSRRASTSRCPDPGRKPKMTDFPIDQVRAQFPALKTRDDGLERIYFDAPGGTQACGPAIARMREHLERGTANSGGAFSSSIETDAMSEAAHAAVADLLGGQPGEIAFGPNMTTLTFSVSRALAKDWGAGDELVLTRLDHDANVAPWLLVARDRGMRVRWIDFDPETGMLDIASLPGLLGPRTRLVAFGGASNALGTLNDIGQICTAVRAHSNALIYVDAVQSVPHVVTDVSTWGATSSPARHTNSSARTRASSGAGASFSNGWMPIRCGPPRSSRRRCASKPARPPSRGKRA